MKIPAVLFVSSLLALAALGAEKLNDATAIQGIWLPVQAQLSGKSMKQEVLKIITLKLENGKYEVTAENVDKGTYTINPASNPGTIDITGVEGPNVGKRIPAIYELNGDTLRICYNLAGGVHPTAFQSASGTQQFLVTYKRKKA